jgi:hypothetical protein
MEIREPGQLHADEHETCAVQVCLTMPSSCQDDCDDHLCGAPATHAYPASGYAMCPRHWADSHPLVVAPAYRDWWEAHRPGAANATAEQPVEVAV